MNFKINFKYLLLLFITIATLNCSDDDNGTTTPVAEELPEELPEVPNNSGILRIPVTHHILRTDGGNNPTTTEARVNRIIEEMNAIYLLAEIEFFTQDIRFVNNTAWTTSFDRNDDFLENRVLLPFENPNALNIFYFNRLTDGDNGTLGATALLPNQGNNIKLSNSAFANSNVTTAAHEVGHYLSLLHTDEENIDFNDQTELVNGSNCNEAGDFICDTPASPLLIRELIDENCNYIGDLTDANGETFTPDVLNIMNTFNRLDANGIACRRRFSPQQIARMRATIVRERAFLIGGNTCDFTVFNGNFSVTNSNPGGAPFTDQEIVEDDTDQETVEYPIDEVLEEEESSVGFVLMQFANDVSCEDFTIRGDLLNLGCFNTDITIPITFLPDASGSDTGTATIPLTNFACTSESGSETLQYTIEATGRYSIENISITLTYNLRLEGQIDAESEILTFELIPGGDQEDEFDEEDPTDEELNEEEVDEEDPTDEELNEEEIDEEDSTDE